MQMNNNRLELVTYLLYIVSMETRELTKKFHDDEG